MKRILFVTAVILLPIYAQAGDWPGFRGKQSSGRAETADKLPAELGPDKNVLWKTPLPPGHSSPVIVGDRIYLTGVHDKKLVTICLDRGTGTPHWETVAPHEKLEPIHSIGSHAQSSPTADGERVVTFFGSCGLFCYDTSGNVLWKRPMGPFKNDFGAGSSPVIEGDWVILCQDHDQGSFLMALDKRTGEPRWRTDRSEFSRNYCTPVVWEVGGKKQIVVAATLRVVGYEFETGKELWTVRGISRVVCMTPVIGDDNTLYAAGWSAGGGGEDGERISVEPFDVVLKSSDANKNGTLEEDELPKGDVKQRFTQCDRDKNGSVTKAEYEEFRGLFDMSKNAVLAIKPGATGDATDTHVLWAFERFVPFCSSPLYYEGRIFTVKDGGIFSCLNAKTGASLKKGRVEATGNYYSSPVAGDGKVYITNESGQLNVVSAADNWQVLSSADFKENVYATPALVDGRIYLRTAGHLYCFGLPDGK